MDVTKAVNIRELRDMAKRRVPEIMFDYLEGGVDDHEGLEQNLADMRRYRLVPRYCTDVSQRSLKTEVFGRTYAMPIGIAPTGQVGLYHPKGELVFAEAAARANIPYTMSAVASTRLEEVVAKAPEHVWWQLYGFKDWSYFDDMLERAKNVGVKNVVVTIDVPVAANREGLRRNGFMGKMPLRIKLEALKHPGWLWRYYSTGGSEVANYMGYAKGDPKAAMVLLAPAAHLSWDLFSRARDKWKGKILVKGVLHPADATKAIQLGADGIWVSNHGGRQLDRAPSSIEMLPLIRKAIGKGPEVVIDSGIRRGSDVILARCLGASMAFMGRVPNYAVAAGGLRGVSHAIDLLRNEMDLVLAQMGCKNLDELGPQFLFDSVRGEFLG